MHHLEVVLGAHPQALGLEQLSLLLEEGQPLLELVLDAADRLGKTVLAGDVVGRRVDGQVLVLGHLLAGERVDDGDGLDLVAEELDPHGGLVVGGVHLERVAPHPELAAHQVGVVAVVVHVDQLPQDLALVVLLPHLQVEQVLAVLVRRAQAVDAGHRGNDDDVAPGEQRRCGGVTESVDLVVDGQVLLDVRVAGRHVRLGLVVVVVADEVLDLVVGEELPELRGQLRGQRLVGGDDQRRLLDLLDGPADGGALAGAGDAEERLVALAGTYALREGRDGSRLVAGRLVVGHHAELGHETTISVSRDLGPSLVTSWRAGVSALSETIRTSPKPRRVQPGHRDSVIVDVLRRWPSRGLGGAWC